jgi:tetratricopeptide (TPR) repeat protein
MTRFGDIHSRLSALALFAATILTLSSVKALPQAQRGGPEATATFESLSKQAAATLDADKLDEAIPLFRRALALNPRWSEGWWSLGTAYYDEDRFAEATIAIQKVLALNPRHGTAYAMLGLCEFELGDDAKALHDIEASKNFGTDIDPQLRDVVFFHEGVLLQRAGRFVAAQKAFSSLCLGATRSPDVIRAFGMAALQIRDKEVPVPGSESARVVEQVGHAACLAAQKDFDASRREFTAVVDHYPHFPYVHYAFGRELTEVHDIAAAVAEFRSEIAGGHDGVLPRLQIAAAEYRVDSAGGLPYAQQAVSLAPQMPFAHFLLGLLLMDTGAYEEAIPELEAASKGMPDESKVFWSLAAAYGHVGRAQEAVRARAEFARLRDKAAEAPQHEGASESPDVPVNISDEPNTSPRH